MPACPVMVVLAALPPGAEPKSNVSVPLVMVVPPPVPPVAP